MTEQQTQAMKLALEALVDSIDLVEENYANAVNLYGKYPSRAKRLIGMETMRDDHRKAITALTAALEQEDHIGDANNMVDLQDKDPELIEQPAIKQSLTTEQQEPVSDLELVYLTIIAWDEGGGKRSRRELARRITALYTRPQAREPLTDEEIADIRIDEEFDQWGISEAAFRYVARAIEQAHGITGEKK